MSLSLPRLRPFGFGLKLGLAAILVVLADVLFWGINKTPGSTVGVFTGACLLAAVIAHPPLRRDWRAMLAAALAGLYAIILFDKPGRLAWLLFWIALTVAVLLPRVGPFKDSWRWLGRLVLHGCISVVGPLVDLQKLDRLRRGKLKPKTGRILALLAVVALPVIGGGVFLALFTAANPVISQALARIQLPNIDLHLIPRMIFWGLVAVLAWSVLRPRYTTSRQKAASPRPARLSIQLPGLSVLSVILSLVVFNALFALQNGLDIAFLWSGAGLPQGVTLAEYAHRGAYPLIVTALLAGAFVLIALRPGSETARRPLVRWLVTAWVAQNIFLVASSILRTLDYIEVYSLTELRIAALVWMALVAVGLALICWRMLRNLSGGWLINACTVATAAVLTVCAVADLNHIAAAWNVRHAKEVGGRGAALDLYYLQRLDASALVPLVVLEQRALPARMADKVTWLRWTALTEAQERQADWRSWTWRNARRLQKAEAIRNGRPWKKPLPGERNYDGELMLPGPLSPSADGPPVPLFAPTNPLTSRPQP